MPETWNRQFIEVKTITPVHIGSGQTLTNNADFVVDKQQVKIPHQKQLADTLNKMADTMSAEQFAKIESSDKLETITEVISNFDDVSNCYTTSHLDSQQKLYEIRAAIKTAFHQPYIPGSSLKGALRSALLSFYRHKLATGEHALPNGKHFEQAIKGFFGEQPQHDLLRALKVGDITFVRDSLSLDCARVISQNKDQQDYEKKFKNYFEGFKVQVMGYGEILFDNNLLAIVQRYNQGNRQPVMSRLDNITLPDDWSSLATILRCHTLNFIEKEVQLLQGRHMLQHYRQFLQKLKQRMHDDPNLVCLQLGYGSGWQGITGDVLTEQEKREAKLGQRYPGFVFPKTRRVNHQGLPLGWIQLKAVDDQTYQQALSQASADKPSAPKELTPGEQWLNENLQALAKQNNADKLQTLRGKQLATAWQAIEDAELKNSALEAIKAAWQEQGWWDKPPGKASKKAKAIYNEADNA